MSGWSKKKLNLPVPSIKISDVMNNRSSKLGSKANNARSSRPDADQQLPSYRKTRPASATAAITVFSWRKKAREKSKSKVRDKIWQNKLF